MNRRTPKNIDDYVSRFPKEVQQLLEKIRLTIRKAAPKAEETISYGIPAFTLDGILVWFAAFKNHIGFYPGASGITAFKKELSIYKGAKGSVQFVSQSRKLQVVRENLHDGGTRGFVYYTAHGSSRTESLITAYDYSLPKRFRISSYSSSLFLV